jgi:hypothetical protein
MSAPYREGQFFLLPLARATGQYAVGLIARVPPRGNVLLGYFFGPRRSSAPGQEWLNGLRPEHAVLACRFKDAQLYRGEWRLLSVLEGFDRSQWPLPAFHRFEGSATTVPGIEATQDWRVEYSDTNLITPVSERAAAALDLKLVDDVAFDATLLEEEVGKRVGDAVPTADDSNWH